MTIQRKEVDNRGMFFISVDDKILAEMTYTMASPTKMIIEHTEVDDELSGRNIGHQLVYSAVEYARNHNIKIIPLCPFANSVFKKKPEYADVLFDH